MNSTKETNTYYKHTKILVYEGKEAKILQREQQIRQVFRRAQILLSCFVLIHRV